MRVHELDRSGGVIAEILAREEKARAARTGVHVGSILDDMMRAMEPKKYATLDTIATATRHSWWAVGNIVEDIIAEGLLRRDPEWVKPEPRVVRGITGSPDGWTARTRTIHEIKATWVSERNFLESLKWLRYQMQGVSYAYMWKAERVQFHVLFLNGNYKPPFPNPRTFTVRPTRAEKETQFDQLEQHAIDIGWLEAA